MAQRDSGYACVPREKFNTPSWVTEAVIPHLPAGRKIWEPACGDGDMVRTLVARGYEVRASDIADGEDFLSTSDSCGAEGIICNPPFSLASAFIQHAIDVMLPRMGFVAMLLPADYDSAKTRRPLFAGCPIFSKTIVLTRRIVWFERADGKKAAPSENHRWFLWSWRHSGPPITRYAP